jgi:methylase of polypeptide subunit release factors
MRATRRPDEHVLTFGGLPIRYDSQVLRPREWTTAQAMWAASLMADSPAGPVLELCAGAGQIGLLATRHTSRRLVLVDISPDACHWARINAAAHRPAAEVEVRQAHGNDGLRAGEQFAVIIADPPWVRSADVGVFTDDPPLAIDGGESGAQLITMCLELIDRHLMPGGAAVLQVGNLAQVDAAALHLAGIGSAVGVREVRTFEDGVLALLRPRGRKHG